MFSHFYLSSTFLQLAIWTLPQTLDVMSHFKDVIFYFCFLFYWVMGSPSIISFPIYHSKSVFAFFSKVTLYKGLSSRLCVFRIMTLDPNFDTATAIKDNIAITVQSTLPASVHAASIAPQLAIINQWAEQIPTVLNGPDGSANANLIFAIRKDLFIAPQFIQCVLGIPVSDLPIDFQGFLSMILKLIGAQKPDKEKPPIKVFFFLIYLSFSIMLTA